MSDSDDMLRSLPAMGKVLEDIKLSDLISEYGRELVKSQLNLELGRIRDNIVSGVISSFEYSELLQDVIFRVNSISRHEDRRVINATGIILHTGLGRAPLADEAVDAVRYAAKYTPVQSDPVTGKRSLRESKVERLIRQLTGAEAATVVNNNAAATMLVLNTLARGKNVVISRGQLVEIGGAFRMPDVMEMSGAVMKEIGTTNRTHLQDYRNAFDEDVSVLMHVHTSNYRLRGFGGTPGIAEITELAEKLGVYAVDDLGSGALVPLEKWGAESEPLVRDSIAAGVDLCCFSGDKLIGGAQAGIICGKAEHVQKIRKNPFARMFRVDKMTLAALEATLAIWVNGEHEQKIPMYRMLGIPKDELKRRAETLLADIKGKIAAGVELSHSEAYIGSGSLPDSGVESWAVVLKPENIGAEEAACILRKHGVFARVSNGRVWLDVISLLEGEYELLIQRIIESLGYRGQD